MKNNKQRVRTNIIIIVFVLIPFLGFSQRNPRVKARAKNSNKQSAISCNKLVNPSFEEPSISGSWEGLNANQVPGWNINTGTIEIWNNFPGYPSQSGNHHLELNGTAASTIYQDVTTTPKANMIWSLWHRNRENKSETIEIIIGGVSQRTITTSSNKWVEYKGTYKVPKRTRNVRFSIKAITTGSVGNLIDNVSFGLDPTKCFAGIELDIKDEVCNETDFDIKATINIKNNQKPITYEFSIADTPYLTLASDSQAKNCSYTTKCYYSDSPQPIKVRITDNKGCKYISEKDVTIFKKITTNAIIRVR